MLGSFSPMSSAGKHSQEHELEEKPSKTQEHGSFQN